MWNLGTNATCTVSLHPRKPLSTIWEGTSFLLSGESGSCRCIPTAHYKVAQVLPYGFKMGRTTLSHRSTIVMSNYFISRAYINTGSVINYPIKIYELGSTEVEPNLTKIRALRFDYYCNSIEIGRSNKTTKSFRLYIHGITSFILKSKSPTLNSGKISRPCLL